MVGRVMGGGEEGNWHKARFEFALVKLMQLYPTKRLSGEPSAGARSEIFQPQSTLGMPNITSTGYTLEIAQFKYSNYLIY